VSFPRHGEIYRPIIEPGQPRMDRPSLHRYDEFPAGYSLAGCAPAEPASASPAGSQVATDGMGKTIEKQQTVKKCLNCLSQPRGQLQRRAGLLHSRQRLQFFRHTQLVLLAKQSGQRRMRKCGTTVSKTFVGLLIEEAGEASFDTSRGFNLPILIISQKTENPTFQLGTIL